MQPYTLSHGQLSVCATKYTNVSTSITRLHSIDNFKFNFLIRMFQFTMSSNTIFEIIFMITINALEPRGFPALIVKMFNQRPFVFETLSTVFSRTEVSPRHNMGVIKFDDSNLKVFVLRNRVALNMLARVRFVVTVTALISRRFVAVIFHVSIALDLCFKSTVTIRIRARVPLFLHAQHPRV